MCGCMWMGWMDGNGLKLEKNYKIWMNAQENYSQMIGFLLYPCIPLTTKQTQSIGWEPVASTNHTNNCLIGSEPEYDHQGDGWEDQRSCSYAQVWLRRWSQHPLPLYLMLFWMLHALSDFTSGNIIMRKPCYNEETLLFVLSCDRYSMYDYDIDCYLIM